MKKHLFGTILVLAALAACNKEVETPAPVVDNGQEEVTPGKVTLTFKAAIDEATRTTYEEDQIAHWAAGDAISVCVTDNESFDVVDFITNDGITFTGEVESGYTTIISGVYPANDVYSSSPDDYFEDGAVKSVYLPNSYDLEDADDTGRFIPLIGSYDGESMTFSHFCSAMKVTLTNIPTDATVFTFTTKKQQISGDFSLSNGGRMTLANQDENSSVSFEFVEGSQETRSFYIPIPDGQLTAGSYVTIEKAIENSNNEVLFKKVINSTPTFPRTSDNKDAIRILPPVACWTKKDNWSASYSEKYNKTSKKVQSIIKIDVEDTDNYQSFLISKSGFISKYVSIADYLSSSRLETDISTRTTRTGDSDVAYAKQNAGVHVFVMYGIDGDGHFNGEYQIFELEVVDFSNEGWSMVIKPASSSASYSHTLKVTAPSDTPKYGRGWMTKTAFEANYGSDIGAYIWAQTTGTNTLFTPGGTYQMNPTISGESVVIVYGIDDSSGKRVPTYGYCITDYTF